MTTTLDVDEPLSLDVDERQRRLTIARVLLERAADELEEAARGVGDHAGRFDQVQYLLALATEELFGRPS